MRLWLFEVKKILRTQKGIWILLVCLLLKGLVLAAVPEMKDARIKLSQKQYDKYLEQLYGENTPEKMKFIMEEYQNNKKIQGMRQAMDEDYEAGRITEQAWFAYAEELNQAYLHENAVNIFLEKTEQFAMQPTDIPPAHYIYEYGWKTVYTLQKLPDVCLLLAVLVMTAQCFSAEASGGILSVLLAAKNGRKHLFFVKLLALMAVSFGGAAISSGLEAVIFYLRGFLNDGGAPLYSITLFTDCPLPLTLRQAYLLSLGIRVCATMLFAGTMYGISVWLRNTANLLFAGLCVLLVPFVLAGLLGTGLLFTHAGLLCSSRMLILLGQAHLPLILPLGVVGTYSFVLVCFAMRRHQKGL